MKRILLGISALVTFVSAGSASVFLAHRYLSPANEQQTEVAEAPLASARDVPPTPIPVSSNPFIASRPVSAASDDGAVDNGAVDNGGAEQPRASADIPDAGAADDRPESLPANRAADPFGLRQRTSAQPSRYPERQAAAEEAEPEEPEPARDGPEFDADEPRRLTPVAREEQVDRYGRPATKRPPSTRARAAAVEEPAATQPLEETPVAEEAPAEQPAGEDGTGRPGDPQLSGAQAPNLTIEKTAPREIQIGKPAKFVIKVRNTGSVVAQGVEIHDTIPQGTQLIESSPESKRSDQGILVWELGALKPNEEQKIELQLMPTAEGEIGSVATVHFRAEASVRTLATKPMLALEVKGPDKVMKGEEATFKIRLSNPGTGAATGVVVTENVPEGLSHSAGKELEFEVGTLKPGESRELELGLLAAAPGNVTNIITARGEANLQTESRAELEVIAPDLQVSLTGPKRRYLERNATHNISVSNPGTAAAKDIELVAVIPKELKFVEANNGGQFDAATHSVYWSLEELPPQETGTVTLTTLPLQPGEAKLLIKSKAQRGLTDQREEVVAIEGLAAINFQLSDTSDPIEAGGQTSYEVRVTNQGSKAAGNVRLVALVPAEMKALSAEGPVRYKIDGQRVVFEPLKQLAPKADASFTIKVQALAAGDLRLQVQLATDEIREPITKEESTRVFGDE